MAIAILSRKGRKEHKELVGWGNLTQRHRDTEWWGSDLEMEWGGKYLTQRRGEAESAEKI